MFRNLLFGVAVFCLVSSPLISGDASAKNEERRKILEDAENAYMENPEYARKKQALEAVSKERDAIVAKISANNPELEKDIKELEILREEISPSKACSETQTKCMRFMELNAKMNKILLNSKEYARIQLKLDTAQFEVMILHMEILSSSNDPRIIKTIDTMPSSIFDIERMPKAKVEGSPEFQTAVYMIESVRSKNPMEQKWPIVHAAAIMMGKARAEACKKDEKLHMLQYANPISMIKEKLRSSQIKEENFELAYQELLKQAQVKQSEEDMKQMQAAVKQLEQIISADSKYQELKKKEADAAKAFEEAFNEFLEKSELPSAVEYRKFKKIVDELQAKQK